MSCDINKFVKRQALDGAIISGNLDHNCITKDILCQYNIGKMSKR